MKKKIALVLIMVMTINMVVLADDSTAEDEAAGIIFIALGVGVLLGVIIWGITALVSEADAPDDGIRMVSGQTENSVHGNTSSLINFLSHVEVGFTQNDGIYAGLRFRF